MAALHAAGSASKNGRMGQARTFARAAALAVALAAPALGAQTYTVTELVTLEQGHTPVVRGANSAGVAVGGGKVAPGQERVGRRGLLIQPAGGAQTVAGLPNSDDTVVFGINDAGVFVGSSNAVTGVRAFRGNGGAVRDLPMVGGDTSSMALGINNLGHAIGFSSGASGQRAVAWSPEGAVRVLPVRAGMTSTRATAINVRGDIVGIANTSSGRKPVIWHAGTQPATELTLLPGHQIGEALAINSRGDAVGYTADRSALPRAALWTSTGAVLDLGSFAARGFSRALDINDAGTVVGAAGVDHGSRAFVWTRTGGMQDLNALVAPGNFVLTQAVGINNVGDIIATGHDQVPHGQPGHTHAEAHDLPVRVFLLRRAGEQR